MEEEKRLKLPDGWLFALLIALELAVGFILLKSDMLPVFRWWLVMLAAGIAARPLAARLFRSFSDGGYLFGKLLGLLLPAYITWLAASLHIVKFSAASVVIFTLLTYAVIWILYIVKHNTQQALDPAEDNDKPVKTNLSTRISGVNSRETAIDLRESIANPRGASRSEPRQYQKPAAFPAAGADTARLTESTVSSRIATVPAVKIILAGEFVFTTAFMIFCYIKCFNPDAFGTERMMDYGFMQSIYRSSYFPPQDMWFAGESLNYYYFGQYFCTFICRLSFNTVAYGYNLALSMCFAFCAAFAFSLCGQWMNGKSGGKKAGTAIAAIFGAIVLSCSASVHYLIFNFLVPWLWDILAIPGDKPSYWYADSTRYIGYHPETNDRTAHEFPAYSFLLGDLHAHVINIFVVLTILALLYAFVKEERREDKSVKTYLMDPKLWTIAFLLGISTMENFWDFPIYFVVSGAVLLSLQLRSEMNVKKIIIVTAVQGVVVLAGSLLVSLPFRLGFNAMADGIMRTESHTPLYQLAILWALPLILLVIFFVSLLKRSSGTGFRERLRSFHATDLYILLLGLCGAGLILLPELIYVVDIYSGDFKRFNTMFKLSYQAFILLNLVMAYIIARFVLLPENKEQRRYGIRGGVILLLCCGYFLTALRMSAGDVLDYSRYKGLRADRYLVRECEMDADAVYWARDNIADGSVLLEANGSSYTIYNRASVISGLPTVLGWHTHEWLWHNSLEPVDVRSAVVESMYVGADKELMQEYGVDYIFLGSCEYEKYADAGMDEAALMALGEVVYTGDIADYAGRVTRIIKLQY